MIWLNMASTLREWCWPDIMEVKMRHVAGREERNGGASEYNELS